MELKYEAPPSATLPDGCDMSEVPEANEACACPVCGAEASGAEVGTLGRYQIPVRNVVCPQCTLVFQSPRPDEERMAAYYDGPYRRHYGTAKYPTGAGTAVGPGEPGYEVALDSWHRTQAQNCLQVAPAQKGDRVLEIGCRHGRTLGVMKELAGIEAYGIEPGTNEAEQARASGVECFNGVLSDFSPPEGLLFERIQLFHVLEHLHSPLDDLMRLRSWLAPTGRLVIEVPNVRQPYGQLEGNFFQNVHLMNFSEATLGELLRRAGFEVVHSFDSTNLFVVACPAAVEQLPLPFSPESIQAKGESAEDIHQKLRTYAETFLLHQFITQTGLSFEVLNQLCEQLKRPAFMPHLTEVVGDLAVSFTQKGAPKPALYMLDAALQGPHPEQIKGALRELALKISRVAA